MALGYEKAINALHHGDTARGASLLEALVRSNALPNSLRADAHGNLGAAFSMLGRSAEAAAALRASLALRPGVGTWHYNLAILLGEGGARAEAESQYRMATRFEPHQGGAYNNLGNLRATASSERAPPAFALTAPQPFARRHAPWRRLPPLR